MIVLGSAPSHVCVEGPCSCQVQLSLLTLQMGASFQGAGVGHSLVFEGISRR